MIVLPYKRNKARRDKESDNKNRKILIWAKRLKIANALGGSCKICGNDKLWNLCFHHTDPNKKERTITDLCGRKVRYNDFLKEAKKCILLCQNCHREIHSEHSKSLSALHRTDNKKLCLDYLHQNQCICGYNKCLDALEFHHNKEKKFKLSKKLSFKWKNISAEIAEELKKCTVMCRNCHQTIHTDISFFIKNKDAIIEKSKNLTDKNRVNSKEIVLLGRQGFNKYEIAKRLKCSHVRVFEILKSNNLIKNNFISEEEKNKIKELRISGLTGFEIHKLTNRSESSIEKILRVNKLNQNIKYLSEEEKNKIKELRISGLKKFEIYKIFNRSKSAIEKVLKDL
jgi:hypothetical protein